MVRGMCEQGRLSVLMITHKFREVMAFCDEVTVLRHGKLMGEGTVRDLTREQMARMMMGDARTSQAGRPSRRERALRAKNSAWPSKNCAPTTRRASRPCRSCHLQWALRDRRNRRRLGQRPARVGAGARRAANASGGKSSCGEKSIGRAPRDAAPSLPRPAGNAAAKRLRRKHDGGGESRLPRLRPAAAYAAAKSAQATGHATSGRRSDWPLSHSARIRPPPRSATFREATFNGPCWRGSWAKASKS